MFAWAACVFGRLPALPLVFVSAPLPRRGRISPRPALAERSSPAGKGETLRLFCRGLPPPAPRHLTVCGIYRPCQTGAPAAEPGRHCIDFGTAIPRGFAGARWFGQRQIQEKFLGVWGLLSRSPQRSPSPARLLFPQRITAPGGSHARAPSAPVRIRAGEPVCGAGSRYTHPPSVRDGS